MRTVVRNITWMVLSRGISGGLSIVTLIVAPRILGDTDFGKVFLAVTFVQFFELVADFGTTTYVTRTVAREPDIAGHLVLNMVAAKLIWSLALAFGALGLAVVLGYDHTLVTIVSVAALSMVWNTLNGSITAGLSGLQRMRGIAVAGVAQEVVFTVAGVVVLLRGWGVVWYMGASSVATLLQVLLTAWAFRKYWPTNWSMDLALVRRSFAGGVPFFFAGAILVLYGKIDVPLLERMAGDRAVGWYSVAYSWISLPAFFALTVMLAVFPALSARGVVMGPDFAVQANKAVRLVSLVGAPLATGIALIAEDGMRLVYPNHGFERAVPVIRILAVHLPVVSITIVLGMTIAAADRERVWLLVGLVAAVVNISLNFVAIPWTVDRFGNGALGAAAVTVLTEVAIMVGAIILRPAGVLDRGTTAYIFRCALASLAMIAPVVYLAHNLITKIALGSLVFGVFAVVTRILTPRQVLRAVQQVR